VVEGNRFTGLVGRDTANDDRRTGLVFLERGVATRTSLTSTPRMLQLLLVVDLNAETAIFSTSSSSSSSSSVCLSVFFPPIFSPPKKKSQMSQQQQQQQQQQQKESQRQEPTLVAHF
jgi:hypothetical protein